MQKKTLRFLIGLVLFSAMAWLVLKYVQVRQTAPNMVEVKNGAETTDSDVAAPQTSWTFTASESAVNALALINGQVELQLKEYDFGVMVEGVNGLLSDNQNYFAIYLNGDYAPVGLADLELVAGDVVELRYEAITY